MTKTMTETTKTTTAVAEVKATTSLQWRQRLSEGGDGSDGGGSCGGSGGESRLFLRFHREKGSS